MTSFIISLGKEAQNNFLLLFRFNEEFIPIIDEDGKERIVKVKTNKPCNPLRTLALIEFSHWLFFLCAFFAIFADFVDFYLLAIQGKKTGSILFDDQDGNLVVNHIHHAFASSGSNTIWNLRRLQGSKVANDIQLHPHGPHTDCINLLHHSQGLSRS